MGNLGLSVPFVMQMTLAHALALRGLRLTGPELYWIHLDPSCLRFLCRVYHAFEMGSPPPYLPAVRRKIRQCLVYDVMLVSWSHKRSIAMIDVYDRRSVGATARAPCVMTLCRCSG